MWPFTKAETRSDTTSSVVSYINQLKDVYGININEDTALRISAVYASVNIISEALARSPLNVVKNTEEGEEIQFTHHVQKIINHRPNTKQTSFVFRQAMQGQVLLRGNGYAYIVRNRGGMPVALEYLRESEVTVVKLNQNTLEEEVVYMIPKYGLTVGPEDMIWIPAFAVENYIGLSPIKYASVMLEGSYAAMAFNASSYKKGGFFKGVLTIMGKLGSNNKTPAERAKEISSQFDQMYADGNTPVLYDGNTYTPVNLNQRDLQFIEYMRYTVEDIARVFNIPLSKLKNLERAIQSNMESQQLEFITDTMSPWYSKWENELDDKLLTEAERAAGYRIKFDRNALLAGDTAARGEYYTKLFYLGALSPNEIRMAEGRKKRPNGDLYFSGVNLVTQEQVELTTEKMKLEVENFEEININKNQPTGQEGPEPNKNTKSAQPTGGEKIA